MNVFIFLFESSNFSHGLNFINECNVIRVEPLISACNRVWPKFFYEEYRVLHATCLQPLSIKVRQFKLVKWSFQNSQCVIWVSMVTFKLLRRSALVWSIFKLDMTCSSMDWRKDVVLEDRYCTLMTSRPPGWSSYKSWGWAVAITMTKKHFNGTCFSIIFLSLEGQSALYIHFTKIVWYTTTLCSTATGNLLFRTMFLLKIIGFSEW